MLVKLQSGKCQVVEPRFPANRLDDLIRHAENEQRLVEMYVGRPPGWARTLNSPSAAALVERCLVVTQEWAIRYEEFLNRRVTRVKSISAAAGR